MINGTLLLQIFNFYVGYSILKRIILKPALRIIDQHDEKLKQLHHALVDLKNQISIHEEQSKKVWQECARKLVASSPTVDKALYHYDKDQIIKSLQHQLVPLSEEAKKNIIETVTQKLVQNITQDISPKATP